MPRARSKITGHTVTFSTRHLRTSYLDRLRVYGSYLDLNIEEALDRALELGLPLMKREAIRLQKARTE